MWTTHSERRIQFVFLGTYSHNLDAKGRLAIPARFREGLAADAVLSRGADRCLAIYPKPAWNALCARIGSLPLSDHDARMYSRFLFADATVLEPDGQGRILLPADLRTHAGIDRTVCIVGMDVMIEIWAVEAWHHLRVRLDEQMQEIRGRLAAKV